MLSPLYAHWFPPNSAVSGPVYFLWWKQLLVTVISQSLGMYVTDFTLNSPGWSLILVPSLAAMTSSPWYSEIIPNGPVLFLSDFIEEVCHFFQGWWYWVCSTCLLWFILNEGFFLSTFAITLSISQYKGLPLSCSGSEVRFDLLRTSFEMLVQTVFYLKSTAVIY